MTAYVFTLTEHLTPTGAILDDASTTYDGVQYQARSRNGVTMKLARQLVAAGAPDGPVEARGPDGKVRFTSRSLHKLAKWTLKETDARGLQLAPYAPRPDLPKNRPGKPQDGANAAAGSPALPDPEAASTCAPSSNLETVK